MTIDSSYFEVKYAGFWLRLLAYLIDSVLIRIPCIVFALILVMSTALVTDRTAIYLINIGLALVVFLIPPLFGGIFESSKLQATPGKILLNLKVTDITGQPCTFSRAFIRNLAFALSDVTCGVGYLMLCWTKKKQCLHDKVAQCLVTKIAISKNLP